MRTLPWMRVVWLLQIVVAGFHELEAHERQQAREIAQRVYRDRRLDPNDRQKLLALARKAGRGAARGARGRGLTGFRRR
jgi:hypothetical protein